MLRFRAEQRIVDVHGIRFGGQPGQLPVVIIPCLFNPRMKEVNSHQAGSFDKRKVKFLLSSLDRISEKTGNPYTVDIMATTPQAMTKYIGFVSEELGDLPFLFDAVDPKTRMTTAEYVNSSGLKDRAVWNSFSLTSTKEELESVTDNGIKNVIVQAFDRRDTSPKGSLASITSSGLLNKVRAAGAENILIDVAILDVASMGVSSNTISLIRDEIGLPTGCAPANATYQWKEKRIDLLRKNFGSCHAAACAIMQFSGSNYVMTGPIKNVRRVFKACAMTDAMIAYAARTNDIRPESKTHPIYKVL
ncbi:MAG: hypothetical protein WED05_04405 [Candidatus Atabeyarchaeum deiterrae]